jgi:XTP/dITP diphosphohydrolase
VAILTIDQLPNRDVSMEKIYFVTKNKGKMTTFSKIMSEYRIKVVQVPLEMPEPRSDDVAEIAKEKVLYAFEKVGKPCVALDAGFYIDSLNGFPKAFVNFALSTIGVEGILKLLNGKKREGEFRHCLAYMDNTLRKPMLFKSQVRGSLTKSKKGELKSFNWSKLSQVFIPKGANKTLAQMSEEEYYSWRERSDSDKYEREFAKFILSRK